MKNFSKLFKYLKNYKLYIFIVPLFLILEGSMDLFLPSIMANIVNIGIANNDKTYIILNVFFMFCLTFLGVIGGIGSIYFSTKTSNNVIKDIRFDIMNKISKLSFSNLNNIKPGKILTIITNDIKIIGTVFMVGIRFIFKIPIILIGSIIMTVFISFKLSLILVLIVPLLILIVIKIMKEAYPNFRETQENIDLVNSCVRENLGGIKVIKSLVTEKDEIDKFNKINLSLKKISTKAVRIISLQLPIMLFFINLATVIVLWYGNIQINMGNLKIGDIIAFIQYLTNILSMFTTASIMFMMIGEASSSAFRINEVFDLEEDIENSKKNLKKSKINGKIEFKNVSFSYKGEDVLKNINLVIEDKVTAIIGPTGSGKSTLAYLISRFYDASNGEILIDDINIKEYQKSFLRENISIVLQKNMLFNDTIKANIKYGVKKASLKKIKEVSKVALAHDFIMKKENNYDCLIEQNSSNLSGGERQRIALARSLLLNPKVLILDDSMSAIDVNTEKKLKKNLFKYMEKNKIIIISQKISNVMNADKIIVLDNGCITGIGSHSELLKNNKIYKEIYDSQVNGGDIYE